MALGEAAVRGPVPFKRVAVIFAVAFPAALALNFALREAAASLLDVPRDVGSLGVPQLLAATLMPALGNCFGYYMAHRSSSPRALLMFLVPGVGFLTLGMVIGLSALKSGASDKAVAITVLVNLTTVAIVVPMLLSLHSAARRD